MTTVEVGEVVSLAELDSEPALLVLGVYDTTLWTAPLADHTPRRLQRLGTGYYHILATAVSRTTNIDTCRVPHDALSPVLEAQS